MANALARASLRVNRGPHPRLRRALVIAFCLAIAAVLAVGVRAALDPAPASSDVAASLAGRPLTAVHPAGAGFHDGFGLSAASALNSLVIGAPLRDRCEGCADEGAVFVAERIGERWRLSQLLAGVAPGGRFGEAIAYRVGGLVIGAPGEGGGVVYIYESSPDGFRLPQRFDPALPAGSRFGAAISATDEYLVVAAPGDDRAAPDAGAVLLYRQSGARDEWLLDDVLTVDSGESAFGRAVAAGNQWLAVSAAADPRDPASTGAVYVYGSIDGRWELQARLVGSDTAPGDDFGTGLAMSGDRIVVGSPRAGEGARARRSLRLRSRRRRLGADGEARGARRGRRPRVRAVRSRAQLPGRCLRQVGRVLASGLRQRVGARLRARGGDQPPRRRVRRGGAVRIEGVDE